MVHPGAEVNVLRQVFDADAGFLLTLHIVFVALGLLGAKFSFNDVGEGVGYLRLACEDSPHEGWSLDRYGINRSEIRRIKAILYERLYVKLQVEPYTFKDHACRNARMHGLARYIVFRVGVGGPAVENQTLLLLVLV